MRITKEILKKQVKELEEELKKTRHSNMVLKIKLKKLKEMYFKSKRIIEGD